MKYLILDLNDKICAKNDSLQSFVCTIKYFMFCAALVIHLAQMFEEMKCVVCWLYDGQSFCKVNMLVVVLGSSGFNWH
jgi:hypothetical protein